jgi:hypothetical protein
MLNNKVIMLSGYARGGTNIAWNLIQSHPGICSPVHETGNLFRKSIPMRMCHEFPIPFIDNHKIIDRALHKFKLANMNHPDNKFAYEGVPYTKDQLSETSLCLKSVDYQIIYTRTILKVYPQLYFIALTRNGYALADGLIRRGKTVSEIGNLYYQISEKMKKLSDQIPRFRFIKFEDIIEKPFSMAEELFDFTEVTPVSLEKLRFKSKKVISREGDHQVKFGNEHRKYWFDRSTIHQILDPNINKKQMERLSPEMIREFNKESGSALEFFGYEKY